MTFEIIIIVAVFAFVVSGILSKKKVGPATAGTSRASPAGPKPGTPQVQFKLEIDGTEGFAGDTSFVKAFGVPLAALKEVRVAKGFLDIASAPAAVRRCLSMLRDEGNTRGPDIARLVGGLQGLPAGQAVYFVQHGDRDIVAFQDIAR